MINTLKHYALPALLLSIVFIAAVVIFQNTRVLAADGFSNDFESGTNEFTTHGTKAKFFHINDAKQAHKGSKSLKIVSQNSVNQPNKLTEMTRWMTNIDTLPVSADESYRVQAFFRTESVKDSSALAVSFFANNKGSSWLKTDISSKKATGTSGWQKISLVVAVPPGATFLRPEFRLYDKGTLWIDDLTITKITSTPTEESANNPTPAPAISAEEQPGEQVTSEEPQTAEVNAPPQPIDSAKFKVSFDPSAVLSANAVPAGLTMRVSFPTNCTLSHSLKDDPIVYPGKSGASHSHDFFGDTKLDASSTTQTILDNGGNTCLTPDDRSAYWVPSVYQGGVKQQTAKTNFYYKAGFVNPKLLETIPLGLRIIAGNANTKVNQSPQVGFWWSSPKLNSPEDVPNLSNSTRGKNKMISVAKPTDGISLRINFPQCWDGENLWLPNSAHMAYPESRKGNKYAECPASHPKTLPMLLLVIEYPNAKGGESFTLASGPWYTFHADFINAWHPQALQGLIDACLKNDKRCRNVRPASCAQRGIGATKCVDVRPKQVETSM